MGSFTDIIQRVADSRAENGAEQSRLGMANELLIQNQTNLIIQVREAKCTGTSFSRYGGTSEPTH